MRCEIDPDSACAGEARAAFHPSRRWQLANLAISQIAWFTAILSAAHQVPFWGLTCVLAAIAWHLRQVRSPRLEAALVVVACLVGFAIESMPTLLGHVRYASGQPDVRLAPYWMVGLWGLFAISLNVTLRGLHRRWWLAALLGLAGGPVAFSSGVSLGGAVFVDHDAALATIALSWAVVLPLLVRVSQALDGVSPSERLSGE